VTATRVLYDFYESEPSGGSTAAARRTRAPSPTRRSSLGRAAARRALVGAGYKRILRDYYTRTMNVDGHSTSLPLETNSISLDPDMKDAWGLPRCGSPTRTTPTTS